MMLRRDQVRQLPALRGPLPHPGAENRQKRQHLQENANWTQRYHHRRSTARQTAAACCSPPWAIPSPIPFIGIRCCINASQVTNPSIDPLREPMETRVFLGQKPDGIEPGRGRATLDADTAAPAGAVAVPVMFSAMSYGSISYNAHASLARAAEELGTYYNTGEGGLHEDFYRYGNNTIVQVASGRFGVHKDYLNAGAAIEIKMGQGAKPGIGGHLPGAKIVGDVSRTRMIPEGSDAISPAPHHDIYSIEDLRQLVYSLKEATDIPKAGHRQDCRGAQRGGHCQRHCPQRRGYHRH